jgi:hypothetical protein
LQASCHMSNIVCDLQSPKGWDIPKGFVTYRAANRFGVSRGGANGRCGSGGLLLGLAFGLLGVRVCAGHHSALTIGSKSGSGTEKTIGGGAFDGSYHR